MCFEAIGASHVVAILWPRPMFFSRRDYLLCCRNYIGEICIKWTRLLSFRDVFSSNTSGRIVTMTGVWRDPTFFLDELGDNYPANISSMSCMSSLFLKHQKNADNNRKTFQCGDCGYATSVWGHFRAHRRIHTGEKPFKCDFCKKTFTQKHHCQQHIRTHTGEKPFKCVHCSKEFSRAEHLTAHIRIHTGEKPYECSHCNKRFRERSALNRHVCTGKQETME